VVGLGLGAALAGADLALSRLFPPLLSALLVLSLWKVATGGIHLDGLADCLDGLGGRDVAHRLAIMRDSRIGVFGAAALVMVLLLGVGALAELAPAARGRALVVAPVAGRLAPVLLGAWFGPATPGEGMGALFILGVSRWAAALHLAGLCALSWALLGVSGPVAVGVALGLSLTWAGFLAGRLGGLSGDALGSSVELSEAALLLTAAALAHQGLLA
jgi:adenosylcobinamide-GDP ribazoletransferase